MQAQTVTTPTPTQSPSNNRSTPNTSQMNSNHSQYATNNTEALRQHQNFIQAHQAAAAHHTALRMGQPLGMASFAARGGFPYQMPFGSKPSDLQLQRQYLLDMIRPNHGNSPWKS